MKLPRRIFLQLAAGAAALSAKPKIARAQIYPSRLVRIICPIAPGGGIDAVTRIVAARLAQVWRQQVVVENRTGGSGNIAAEAVRCPTPRPPTRW